VEVRKQVNQLDNLTTSKAVDALLNAETVALFNNRQLEVRLPSQSKYDVLYVCSQQGIQDIYPSCCVHTGEPVRPLPTGLPGSGHPDRAAVSAAQRRPERHPVRRCGSTPAP
jgi:hypothetical protein